MEKLHDTAIRNVTCHMGSHSVTFQPTQVNTPRLKFSQAGWYSIYLPRWNGQAELTQVTGYIYRDGLLARRRSPIEVLTQQCTTGSRTRGDTRTRCKRRSYSVTTCGSLSACRWQLQEDGIIAAAAAAAAEVASASGSASLNSDRSQRSCVIPLRGDALVSDAVSEMFFSFSRLNWLS